MSPYSIEITEAYSSDIVDRSFLENAIRRILFEERIDSATVSLALVNDAEIHRINREFLGHDNPTDVISFILNESNDPIPSTESAQSPTNLEGELVVSIETAIREAVAHGWSPRAELLLYVVHGLLHLCGYDDLTDEARPEMRSRERELLALWGFCPTGLET